MKLHHETVNIFSHSTSRWYPLHLHPPFGNYNNNNLYQMLCKVLLQFITNEDLYYNYYLRRKTVVVSVNVIRLCSIAEHLWRSMQGQRVRTKEKFDRQSKKKLDLRPRPRYRGPGSKSNDGISTNIISFSCDISNILIVIDPQFHCG